jgi:hypothetical protein
MPTTESLEEVDAQEVIQLLEAGGMTFTPAKKAVVVRVFKDAQPRAVQQPAGCAYYQSVSFCSGRLFT